MPLNASQIEASVAAIELAWQLDPAQPATAEQRALLSGFTGWGALAPAFNRTPEGRWVAVADRLEAVLPDAAYRVATEQCDTSFYTPPAVADAIYRVLAEVGFTGGSILEPGCGHGALMAAAPAGWDVTWTGVDIDPTATRIATLRTPGSRIITGKLEQTPLRDGGFDAIIGNVPFSGSYVSDAEGRSGKLHNYFLTRALDAIRPGGYIALITSRFAIDTGDLARTLKDSERGQLVGAVRLPSGAFADSGTDVVADLLVVRGGTTARPYPFLADTEAEATHSYYSSTRTIDKRLVVTEPDRPGNTVPTPVSRYWEQHPEHVAGTMKVTTFAQNPLVVRSTSPATDLDRALSSLLTDAPAYTPPEVGFDDLTDVVLEDTEGRKEGSFHVIDGAMHRVTGGCLTPARASKELTSLVHLRDLAVALLTAEADPQTPDKDLTPTRAAARSAYEAYVATFGPLNRGTLVEGRIDDETGLPALSWRRPPMGGFRKDPDAPLVMALEVFDQDTGVASPAPILHRRVNHQPVRTEHVDTPAEALAVSLGETGAVDLGRIAGLLDIPTTAVRGHLGDLVFDDPDTRALVPASEYLSGNVHVKLRRARAAGMDANAAALDAILPPELGPLEISMNLGSPFVTPADMEAFMREVLGERWPRATLEPEQRVWEVAEARGSADARMEYGTADVLLSYLVECALNGKMPEVRDPQWGPNGTTYVRNIAKTAAAAEKLAMIADRFSTWVWEDQERSERICRDYNDTLGGYVTRSYDGAGLTFPGLAADVTPWAHQRAAVERIVSTPRAMIGHWVGAGKTLTMALAALTLRQFGLARKPLIVVPNHLLDQISREVQQAYPTGRFLIATKDDLARDARRLFAARCATGDWDAVIMTHASFTAIPVHPDTERAWVEDQKDDLVDAIYRHGSARSKGAKAIARSVRALDQRISKLRRGIGDQDAIWFDQLGVDYIMLDEAHLARRLATGSTQRDSGLGSGSSKRATDLLVKIETLASRRPAGAPVVSLFTGTPFSNTLAEMWVWQRMLQPDQLRWIGLLNFDAWRSAFVRNETAIEVAPDGSGFRMQRRPVGLMNAPEVKTMFAQVADLVGPEKLGLARPQVTTRTVVVPATTQQSAFVRALADRADNLRAGQKGRVAGAAGGEVDDSMLLICNDGRKVALDPRLVGLDEDSAKIEVLAGEIATAYRENAGRVFPGAGPRPGGFQLAFLDLGTPKPEDTATYGRLRRRLVDLGVPSQMVRFIHDAKTDKARAALFASCRSGEVAVLIGSTAKVGMGTNVQTRLTHLWHADAPWLPAEMIQRDGRGDRPHNLAGHLTITRMVAEGTFDAYMWQALERKSRSFDALYASGATARELEDVSAASLDYAEIKAAASGNPLLLEQAKARASVKRLQLLRAVHLQSVRKAEQTAKASSERAQSTGRFADLAARAMADTTVEPGDRDLEALSAAADAYASGTMTSPRLRFTWRGLTVRIDADARAATGKAADTLSVSVDYRELASFPLGKALRRAASSAVAQELRHLCDRYMDGLPAAISAARTRVAELRADAEASLAAAEKAVFLQQSELTDAIARLARIDAAIAHEAASEAGEREAA